MGRVSVAVWAGLAVAAVVTVVTVWDRAGTAARLQREFGLDRSDVASVTAIGVGLQRKLPLGTNRRAIELFLQKSLAGDKNSMIEFDDSGKERGFMVTFDYDVAVPGVVKETYHIWFAIDESDNLKRIDVSRSLTGL